MLGVRTTYLVAFLTCWCLCGTAAQARMDFTYTLDNRYQTSAGVYSLDGKLIRTLWSNQTREPGTFSATWNGLTDDEVAAPTGVQYEIRVLTHNVNYQWDGVIGSTIDSPTNPTQFSYPYFMQDFEIVGRRAYAITTTEGVIMRVRWHDLDHPNAGWHPMPGLQNMRQTYLSHLATDGVKVFVARTASKKENVAPDEHASFVVAMDADLNREIKFPKHGPLCTGGYSPYTSLLNCYSDGRGSFLFASGIDVTRPHVLADASLNDVTGMAVQRSGSLLFVAHGKLGDATAIDPRTGFTAVDELHVLDKNTGDLLQSLPLRDVRELAVCSSSTDSRGLNTLWALFRDDSNQVVLGHFSINNATKQVNAKPNLVIKGFSKALNVSVSHDCNTVVVADGGIAQQFKAYDATTGASRWILGQAGGYLSNGPTVSANKFSFTQAIDLSDATKVIEHAFVGFQEDGSFWASDTGLTRLLKFDEFRQYRDQMAWMPINYHAKLDQNNPTRVFQGFKEYRVDYSKPITQSWTLVQDYSHDLPASASESYRGGVNSGPTSITTLSNGRTYALAWNGATNTIDLFEIKAGSTMRKTKHRFPNGEDVQLAADGRLRYLRRAAGTTGKMQIYEHALAGFDLSGDPIWTSANIVAIVPTGGLSPKIAHDSTFDEFDDRTQVLFDGPLGNGAERFRLGAIRAGGSTWQWRASKSQGRFNLEQPDGRYDYVTPQNYTAKSVDALGEHAIYSYYGEGWNGGQANQFLHFHQSGLFVGQFGTPNIHGISGPQPGLAGNSFSIQMVKHRGKTYFWHNTEHTHDGHHRWRLDGLEWLRFWRGRGVLDARLRVQLTPDVQPERLTFPAPTDLQAVAVGNRGLLTTGLIDDEGSHHLLIWRSAGVGEVTAYELQKLRPNYLRPSFVTLARLNADELSFIDTEPNLGGEDIYRVRAWYGEHASDWSRHIRIAPKNSSEEIYKENFDGLWWSAFPPHADQSWHRAVDLCIGDFSLGAICDRHEVPNANVEYPNAVLRNRISVPPAQTTLNVARPLMLLRSAQLDGTTPYVGQYLNVAREFNEALARPIGSKPIFFRLSFSLKSVSPPKPAQSGVRPVVALTFDIHPVAVARPFALTGGRFSLPFSSLQQGTDSRGYKQFSTVFAAVPNGRTGYASGGYLYSESEPTLRIAGLNLDVEGSGLMPNSSFEFWMDDLRLERLHGEENPRVPLWGTEAQERLYELHGQTIGSPYLAGDDQIINIQDPALRSHIRSLLGLSQGSPLLAFHLRLLAYLDLRGLKITSLRGLEAATSLRAINITGVPSLDVSALVTLSDLGVVLGSEAGPTRAVDVPVLPLFSMIALAVALGSSGGWRSWPGRGLVERSKN